MQLSQNPSSIIALEKEVSHFKNKLDCQLICNGWLHLAVLEQYQLHAESAGRSAAEWIALAVVSLLPAFLQEREKERKKELPT